MYSPRLYKYRDSYVLYIPTVHNFGTGKLYTHSFGTDTHTTFPPPAEKQPKDLTSNNIIVN